MSYVEITTRNVIGNIGCNMICFLYQIFKKFLKGINALKFTNLLYIIEFDMINFFPIPNFKKIEEHLIFGSNLDLMEQTY